MRPSQGRGPGSKISIKSIKRLRTSKLIFENPGRGNFELLEEFLEFGLMIKFKINMIRIEI